MSFHEQNRKIISTLFIGYWLWFVLSSVKIIPQCFSNVKVPCLQSPFLMRLQKDQLKDHKTVFCWIFLKDVTFRYSSSAVYSFLSPIFLLFCSTCPIFSNFFFKKSVVKKHLTPSWFLFIVSAKVPCFRSILDKDNWSQCKTVSKLCFHLLMENNYHYLSTYLKLGWLY